MHDGIKFWILFPALPLQLPIDSNLLEGAVVLWPCCTGAQRHQLILGPYAACTDTVSEGLTLLRGALFFCSARDVLV